MLEGQIIIFRFNATLKNVFNVVSIAIYYSGHLFINCPFAFLQSHNLV